MAAGLTIRPPALLKILLAILLILFAAPLLGAIALAAMGIGIVIVSFRRSARRDPDHERDRAA